MGTDEQARSFCALYSKNAHIRIIKEYADVDIIQNYVPMCRPINETRLKAVDDLKLQQYRNVKTVYRNVKS